MTVYFQTEEGCYFHSGKRVKISSDHFWNDYLHTTYTFIELKPELCSLLNKTRG
jgi:hypothetical protein